MKEIIEFIDDGTKGFAIVLGNIAKLSWFK